MALGRRSFLRGVSVAAAGAAGLSAAGPASAAAVIGVQRSGPSREASAQLFGLNGNNTQRRMRWDRAELRSALRRLDPGTIRYPGGTIGNYWDWQSGWFQPNGPWPGQTNDLTGEVIEPFDNSLGPFAAALAACDAAPVLVLNMLTVDGRLATASDNVAVADGQVEFLRAAAAGGVPVRQVELGNEFYLAGAKPGPHELDYATRFPTASSYARQANAWIPKIRNAFPAATISAVGADATGTQSPRREGWNAGVLAELTDGDALTLHPYIVLRDPGVTPQSVLSLPHKRVQSLAAGEFVQLSSAGMRAWVTEFNMVDRTPGLTFAGTWTHGLFIAAFALLLAQRRVVTSLNLHNVLGDALAGALFDTTEGFRSPTPATALFARSAMGSTLATVIRATRGARTGHALAFPGGPQLAGGAAGLVGMDFTGPAAHGAVIVNLSPVAVSLDLTGLFPAGHRWTRTTAPSLSSRVPGPSALTFTAGSGTTLLELPAHAVVRLEP